MIEIKTKATVRGVEYNVFARLSGISKTGVSCVFVDVKTTGTLVDEVITYRPKWREVELIRKAMVKQVLTGEEVPIVI